MNNLSMSLIVQSRAKALVLVTISLLYVACSSLIATYNETSYQYATSLKPEALMLMDKATENYVDHADEVEALMLRVEQAYEFVAGIPKNSESAGQWKILKDPDGNLLGGFMRRWKSNRTLGATFIKDVKEDAVGPAFDSIIMLESLKIKQ